MTSPGYRQFNCGASVSERSIRRTRLLQTLGASTDGNCLSMEAMNAEATDLVDCEGDAWWMALARLLHSVALTQLGETSSA